MLRLWIPSLEGIVHNAAVNLIFFFLLLFIGLVALDEQHRKKNQLSQAVYKDLSGKHPVSALMEICNKRRWRPPVFELLEDTGPPHKKQFIFKVRLVTVYRAVAQKVISLIIFRRNANVCNTKHLLRSISVVTGDFYCTPCI